ncbi:MAG TPA: glycosyltransferase family A protein [Candidatus Dormibacteraeota bacterium]|nr:glycosyltransferase family A protein [Candidatus Dormibacteraeota bacterium]
MERQGSELEVSVVVPSHERVTRLRWLLNALEEQTLPQSRWELVVVHDSRDGTEELLSTHHLVYEAALRKVTLAPGTGTAAVQRNVGWREARAPLIAFTDDDCRPEPDWLERLLAVARSHPGAIVQGTTRPDPFEAEIMKWAPRARSIDEPDPPGPHAQTCNILYPRAALEAVGGFDESIRTAGEDLDLAARVRARGAAYVGAPDAVVYHAVDTFSLPGIVRFNRRWETLPLVFKRHPELRTQLEYGVFWKRRHAFLPAALAGAALHRREPLLALLALPYVLHALPHRGTHPMGRMRALAELGGRAVVDASEMWTMVKGSVRYRTLML